jgi:hypothetical protein
MSLWNIIDQGYCPPIETRIRAHRIHSCTDLQFDRDLIGLIRLNGNIPPGAHRTFLHTDNAGLIAWKAFSQDDIPAGADGDYLQTIAGLVQWAPPTFAPSVITPGTARQLLQTNAGATAAEWTSNVDIPGTLDVTGNAVFDVDLAVTNDLNVINGDANIVNGDLNVSNGNITVATGDIDVSTGDVRIVGDLSLGGNLSLNAVSGTSGQYVKKTGATTQTWSDFAAGDIKGGTLNQVLQSDGTGGVFNSNVIIPGTLTTTGTLTTNGTANITADLQFAGVAGTSGQVLKKTGVATQAFATLSASDTKGGTLNQVMQSDGTGGVFNTNVTIPGTLTCNSTATITGNFTASSAANIVGNLQFNGVSGSSGQYLKKTSGTTQAFANITASDVLGGTLNQVLQSNGTNGVYNTNVTIPGTLTVTSTTNLNSNLQMGGVSGTSGQYLKKTSGTTQAWSSFAASDITPGTANQLLVTNGTGTAATWTTDVSFPGNIAMIGAGTPIASLGETRVYYALKLGGNLASAYAGQVCVSDSSSIPHWEDPQYVARYYDSNVVDMNNGGGGALNLLQNASADITNSNISYTSGAASLFKLAQAGTYEVLFQTNATVVGDGAQTLINLKVNGAFAGSFTTIVGTGAQTVNLIKKVRTNSTGTTIAIVSQQLAAGVINTSGNDINGIATTVITITRIGAYVP